MSCACLAQGAVTMMQGCAQGGKDTSYECADRVASMPLSQRQWMK